MRLLQLCKDGGPESRVWAYTLIEIKWLFSIILLRFDPGSRDAQHTHAFNALSWVLRGYLLECFKGELISYSSSLRPIYTPRDRCHKVTSLGTSWVLTFRGPWRKTWQDIPAGGEAVTLTHGRQVVT